MVSAANPGEQGLKHPVKAQLNEVLNGVSAANPGEQGLKLAKAVREEVLSQESQRLIQENKD